MCYTAASSKFAGPYSFNGASCTDVGSLAQTISTSFTLSMWVKLNPYSGIQVLATYGRNSTNYNGEFMLYLDSNGRLFFLDYNNGNGFNTVRSNLLLNVGTRTLVGFVRNGLQGTFYINGVSAGSVTGSQSISYLNSNFNLGCDSRDKTSYFSGTIDTVLVFNSALTAANLLALGKL